MPQPALSLPTPSLDLSIITLPISQTKPQREAGCAEGYVAQCGAGLPQRLKMSLLRWQKEGRVKYSRYSCGYSAPLGLGGKECWGRLSGWVALDLLCPALGLGFPPVKWAVRSR